MRITLYTTTTDPLGKGTNLTPHTGFWDTPGFNDAAQNALDQRAVLLKVTADVADVTEVPGHDHRAITHATDAIKMFRRLQEAYDSAPSNLATAVVMAVDRNPVGAGSYQEELNRVCDLLRGGVDAEDCRLARECLAAILRTP